MQMQSMQIFKRSGCAVPMESAVSATSRRAHMRRAFSSQRMQLARQARSRLQFSASSEASQAEGSKPAANLDSLFTDLADACTYLKSVPPSMKTEASADVLAAMKQLENADAVPKWGKILKDGIIRRNVFLGDLKQVGIKQPDQIAVPSVRNDAAFLYTTLGVCSVIAVLAGQLPGDWGFFVPYLTGAVVLVVLAVGSTAPGLLYFFTDKFQLVFSDYRERVLRHEASHFLIGYLLGVPITGYSLDIGKEHTDFAEATLQQRLIERQLTDEEVNQLAIVSMSGVAAEAQTYDEVVGQTQDLLDLQKILRRSSTKMGDQQQMNMTRWAVYQAAAALRKYQPEYESLMEAMQQRKSVAECIKAIEGAQSSN